MLPSHQPELLLLTHRVPYPPDKGDRIRTYHTLRCLAPFAKIHLIALADEPVPAQSVTVLKQLCERVEIIPIGKSRWLRAGFSLLSGGSISEGAFFHPQMFSTVKQWASQTRFTSALASSSALAQYLWLHELDQTIRIVDVVDVDSQKWFDYAAASRFPKSWLYSLEGKRLRRTERAITQKAHAVTLVSEGEAAMFREFASTGVVRAVTNGVDLDYYHPQENVSESQQDCVFVGALDYKPNVDAAIWFSREIWPTIHRHKPEQKLKLVGRQPMPSVQALASLAGVEVVGQVPDVRPYLHRCAVVVAPLRIARGLQNKVLEAMSAGKPVVASPQALGGFRTEGNPARVASTPEQWTEQILALLDDPQTRQRLGVEGRQFAQQYHHWDECLKPLRELLGLTESVRTTPSLA
ncbi:MAG: TIGR03087 family PEP-CTERM/XrtA system glycosyltransferase [Gemmataceae bacterium]|nr:TIGR03087 family PEP-CTERM/XrtA system glycosyltransferase [Gemmataceae bacterium]